MLYVMMVVVSSGVGVGVSVDRRVSVGVVMRAGMVVSVRVSGGVNLAVCVGSGVTAGAHAVNNQISVKINTLFFIITIHDPKSPIHIRHFLLFLK